MKSNYPHLFSPIEIRGRLLKNRILSAPNMLFQIVDGRPTDSYVGYLEHKAKGGAAIVNLGEVPICDGGTHTPITQLIDKNLNIFGEMADAIKQHGALASAELTHGGRGARPWYNTKPIKGPVTEISNMMGHPNFVTGMTEQDMDDVANAFADAAEYLCKAGFDIAHIHSGHSWLLAQFLSPFVNTRTDEYGGSLENRMRFPLMCVKRVRERVGNRMIVSLRISGSERREGGFTPDDMAEFLSKAQEYVDFAEVSTEGWAWSMPSTYIPWACNVPFAEAIKKSGKVNIPIYVVGSIVSPDMAEEILAAGKADGISFSRALIADPCMPNKTQAGKVKEVVPCLRCMHCTDTDNGRRYFECSVNPTVGHETRVGFAEDVAPAKYKKKVLVIGGGPGGVMAACTAAERGHDVILCEKEAELGGTIRYADYDALKPDLRRYKEYIVNRGMSANIDLRLNTEVTPEMIDEIKPDHIIVATGASPIVPRFIEGWEKAAPITDIYFRPESVKGDNVVIIGGGLSGVEAGLHLRTLDKNVTVLEKFTCLTGVGTSYGWGVMLGVETYGLPMINEASVSKITDEGVYYSVDGEEKFVAADSVFYAVGMKGNRDLYFAIADKAPFVDVIGDCRQIGQVGQAVHNAYFAALDIGSF